MSISVEYPKIARWYNAERREKVPAYNYFTRNTIANPSLIVVHDTSFNEFHLDVTNTDVDNQKTVTLFTYSNGVKVKMDYYYERTYNDYISIRYKAGLYDKDDTLLNIQGIYTQWNGNIDCFTEMNTMDDCRVYYTPPYFDWDNTVNYYPKAVQYNYMGGFVSDRKNASPYDAPTIMGVNEEFDRGNLLTYYFFNNIMQVSSDTDYQKLIDGIQNGGDGTPISPILPSEDTSTTGGGDSGDPTYDPFSDPINTPNIPTVSSLDTGFISAYNPTKQQLNDLSSAMWSNDFVEELLKIWNSPIEGIVSLHMLPFTPPTYGYANCKIGNYNTNISMKAIFTQYQKLQGGQLHVDERWCSALDYSPYTRAFIHIPFVGIQPINIDDVMNKTVVLEYIVDVLTGVGIAFLKCDNAVLHTYPCSMAMKIPFTMSDHQLLIQSLNNLAVSTAKATTTGSPSDVAGAISSAMNVVTSKHSTVQKSGVVTSSYGMLDNFSAYIILHRPIQSLASDFAHFKGYPCNITYTLSSLSGYTEVEYAHLEGVTATDEEKDEIQSLLRQGVIL